MGAYSFAVQLMLLVHCIDIKQVSGQLIQSTPLTSVAAKRIAEVILERYKLSQSLNAIDKHVDRNLTLQYLADGVVHIALRRNIALQSTLADVSSDVRYRDIETSDFSSLGDK